MLITFLSKQRKKTACTLLAIFLFQIASPVISFAKPPQGDGTPVSAQLAKYVDPFTGDFSYSIPLLTVPGPNGENYPINLNYRAGIQMNQEASWVGLGWNLNPGEISRTVNGVPDDWKGKTVQTIEYKNATTSPTTKTTTFYGPMYFKNFPIGDNNMAMDVYQSNMKISNERFPFASDNDPFEFPDYDNYYASGAGLNGEINPHLLDFASLVSKNVNIDKIGGRYTDVEYNYDDNRDPSDPDFKAFSKSLKFLFKDEYKDYVLPHYGKNYKDKSQISPPPSGAYISSQISSPKTFTENYTVDNQELTSDVLSSGYVVKYFTNKEITNNRQTSVSNLMSVQKFLDYQKNAPAGAALRQQGFDPDGIGAFQVTSPQGYVYHYSLPVYTLASKADNFIFSTPDITNPANDPYGTIDQNKEYTIVKKDSIYATTWKLTAITGPDFEDANSDGVADVGDKGYWIAFNYGKWADDFYSRFPFYGFMTTDILSQYSPSGPHHIAKAVAHDYQYLRDGSVAVERNQKYYLNAIQTSTHTAYFIKDIRNDVHSLTDGSPIPELKLKKIILVKNEDMTGNSLYTSQPLTSDQPAFTTNPELINSEQVVDIADYNYVKTQIEGKILKTINLDYDYSLCKENPNNITTPIFTVQSLNYGAVSGLGCGNAVTSTSFNPNDLSTGKLTLNQIHFLEKGGANIYPSYIFDYDKNSPNKNPNLNTDAQDFWGYYKSDFHPKLRGHYTTDNSQLHTDAWSLKKITTPLGAEITVQYESDRYAKVGYDGASTADTRPSRTFLIYNYYPNGSSANSCLAYLADNDALTFINASSNADRVIGFPLKKDANTPLLFFGSGTYNTYKVNFSINNSSDPIYESGGHLVLTTANTSGMSGIDFTTSPIYEGNGFISAKLNQVYGGGIRVKSVSIKDPATNQSYKQEYTYTDGIATSEPSWFSAPSEQLIWIGPGSTSSIYPLKTSEISSDRHVMKPNVGYTHTTVKNIGLDNSTTNGSIKYQFNNYKVVLNPVTMNELNSMDNITYQVSMFSDQTQATYRSLDKIAFCDENDNVLRLEKNEYTTVGRVDETAFMKYTFSSTSTFDNVPTTRTTKKVSVRRWYNSMLTSKSVYEKGELKNKFEVVDYDRFTGSPTKTINTDRSEGVKEITTTPAYTIYSPMRSKSINPVNKNLLTAVAKTQVKSYGLNELPNAAVPETEKTLVAGQMSEWDDVADIRSFNPLSDKYETNSSVNFWKPVNAYLYNGNTNENNWKLQNEITLYDPNGNILETKSNLRYNASKFGKENHLIAKATNSSYSEFIYCGFEEISPFNNNHYASEVLGADYQATMGSSPVTPHTGSKVAKFIANGGYDSYKVPIVNAGAYGGFQKGKKYVAKVWIHKDSPAGAKIYVDYYNGSTYVSQVATTKADASNITVGDWILASVNFTVPLSNSTLVVIGLYNYPSTDVAYFDDFMVGPADAEVTGYVNDPQTGWTQAIINNDGFATFFEYDAAGRITYTKKETAAGIKVVSHNRYNFAR